MRVQEMIMSCIVCGIMMVARLLDVVEGESGRGSFQLLSFSLAASDQQVLVDFYNGLDDRGSLGWNTSADLCWQTGVYCDGAGFVSAL